MTQAEIFNLLFNGGNFSRKWLVKLIHPTAGTLYYVNNNEAIDFNGDTYIAANFDYTEPDKSGNGAKFEISATDNHEVVEWIENADYNYSFEVVGVLVDDEVQELKSFRHFYGTVSMSDDNKLSFSFENDGRLDMIFTVYEYDTDLNRGNA